MDLSLDRRTKVVCQSQSIIKLPSGCALFRGLFCLTFYLGGSLIMAEDSPQFRGAQGDGVSLENDWSHQWGVSGPKEKWRAEIGTGFSNVVTSQGLLYALGNREGYDELCCRDAETGETVWMFKYASPLEAKDFEGGPTATPVLSDGVLYLLSRGGVVYALNAGDGSLRWQKDVVGETGIRVPGWGFAGSPRVYGETLVLNIGDSGVALRKDNGDIKWASQDRDAGYSSPVRFGNTASGSVIFGSGRSYVCVDLETGAEQWRQRWLTTFGCNAADAVVSGEMVFLSSGYSRGSALLDLSSGSPVIVWKHKDFKNQLGASVLLDGFLYGINGDVDSGAILSCMDMDTGELAWNSSDLRAGSLIAAGDRLVVLSDSGVLMVIRATSEKYDVLATHPVLTGRCWTAPVLSDGLLFCRNAEGTLVCLDLR